GGVGGVGPPAEGRPERRLDERRHAVRRLRRAHLGHVEQPGEFRTVQHPEGLAAPAPGQGPAGGEEAHDALAVEVAPHESREPAEPLGVGGPEHRRLAGAERPGVALAEPAPEVGPGERAQERVVDAAARHAGSPKASRIAPTPSRSVSALSAVEKASNVTARRPGARPAAYSARSRIARSGTAAPIQGPPRSRSGSTPATCSSTTRSSGSAATNSRGGVPA